MRAPKGRCSGCGREGVLGAAHTKVTTEAWSDASGRESTVTRERCGTFRRLEPAEPETKDPFYPPSAAPKRLVGEE